MQALARLHASEASHANALQELASVTALLEEERVLHAADQVLDVDV
jgi:hypothetical protein